MIYNPDGTFKKYKARLVARGDMLKSKSTDTYSGTVSSQATRLFLGIIAEHDLVLRTFDVKTAFLYTRLNEFSGGIYMRRPKQFSDTEMPAIVRLLGGLYGLDIASKLFEQVTTIGFKRLILIKTVIFAYSERSYMTPSLDFFQNMVKGFQCQFNSSFSE